MCPKAFSFSNPLKACPDKPNCVYSKAKDEHAIEPLIIKGGSRLNTNAIIEAIKQVEANVTVVVKKGHIHAEVTSRVFGFIDDLDLIFNAKENTLHVRSASRKGHYDFGVNRRRIEKLRKRLKKAGIIQ
ncbi:MAG: hypothetical protein A6F71_02530 [Cycloclasticus sp. symbiont of Poecilosclerida sp. M]|nr:MAG: hypothetical protein A6F71_02530 [Cycloclasticus sp. symbiont of Poecilosclerida sp. M]